MVGLREGTGLWIEDDEVKLIGDKTARLFQHGREPKELDGGNIREKLVILDSLINVSCIKSD